MNNRALVAITGAILLIGASSAMAQQVTSGNVATSTVGEVGKRQSRDEATSIEPMARINTRIQNRIQSRLRTRIDRDYSPSVDPNSVFEAATERTRIVSRARQR